MYWKLVCLFWFWPGNSDQTVSDDYHLNCLYFCVYLSSIFGSLDEFLTRLYLRFVSLCILYFVFVYFHQTLYVISCSLLTFILFCALFHFNLLALCICVYMIKNHKRLKWDKTNGSTLLHLCLHVQICIYCMFISVSFLYS